MTDFLRNRSTLKEGFLIASEKLKRVPSREIAERFGVEERVVAKDPLVLQAQNSLADEIRVLAKRNLHGHLDMLATIRDEARTDGKYAAAVQAEKARGQVLGFYDATRFQQPDTGNALEDLSIAELTNLLVELDKGEKNNDGREDPSPGDSGTEEGSDSGSDPGEESEGIV